MTRRVLPRGPASVLAAHTLLGGEIVHDETLNTLRIGDGATPGGVVLAKKTDVDGVAAAAAAATAEVADDVTDLSGVVATKVPQGVHDALAGEVALLSEQVQTAGTTKVVALVSDLAGIGSPADSARAEVVADPLGDVTNGNGIWGYDLGTTAWVWLAPRIPNSLKNAMLALAPPSNQIPDPFLRSLLSRPAYQGVYIRKDSTSPFKGGSVGNVAGGLARVLVRLEDTPFFVGDQVTFAAYTTRSATVALEVAFKAANETTDLGGSASISQTAGTGLGVLAPTTIPANTVYIAFNMAVAGVKKIYGVFGNKGSAPPAAVEAPGVQPSTPLNAYYDPTWQLASAGIPSVNGHALRPTGFSTPMVGGAYPSLTFALKNTAEIDAITGIDTPFTNPAWYLPPNTFLVRVPMAFDDVELALGDVIHGTVRLWAKDTSQSSMAVRTGAVTTASDSYTAVLYEPDAALANTFALRDVPFEITVTQAMLDTADGIRFNLYESVGQPVGAAGAFLVGVSVAKVRHAFRPAQASTRALAQAMATVRSPLAGKTVMAFGDSILAQSINVATGRTIAADIGLRLSCRVVDCSVGGSTLGQHADANFRKLSPVNLLQAKAANVWTDVDAAVTALSATSGHDVRLANVNALKAAVMADVRSIMVAIGTNDFYLGVGVHTPLGALGDVTDATVHGAADLLIKTVTTNWPWIRLGFSTPLYRARQEAPGGVPDGLDSDTVSNGDYFLWEVGDAIMAVARKYRLPEPLDAYRKSGIGPLTATHYLGAGDLLHPNVTYGNPLLTDLWSRYYGEVL